MARVYVSSTSSDLQEERLRARDAIQRLGHQDVCMERYGAAEDRPTTKCVEDVKNCDVYVGIIAWRYGFIPKEGGGRSITQLEYEAAGEAKIPRLLYLASDVKAWQKEKDAALDRISAFRDVLTDAHTVKFFPDPGELELQLVVDLSQQVSRAPSRCDSLLPYFCDRTVQRSGLQQALVRALSCDDGKIPVCFIEGPTDELPDKLVDCLASTLLCEWLGKPGPAREFQVPWPGSGALADLDAQLQSGLASACALPVLSAKRDVIERFIASQTTPAIFTTSLAVDRWEEDHRDRLLGYLDYLERWVAPRGPSLVIFWASYRQEASGWKSWVGLDKYQKKKAALLSALGEAQERKWKRLCVSRLDPLGPVAEPDAVEWARSDRVRSRSSAPNLEVRVRDPFSKTPHIPMRRLVDHLSELLQEQK